MGIDMSQYVPGLNPSLIKESDKKNTENIRYALNTYIDILFFIMCLIYFLVHHLFNWIFLYDQLAFLSKINK